MSRATKRFVRKVIAGSRCGLCPEPTDAKEALLILLGYLLKEEDVFITIPVSSEQAITIIVDAILMKHSHRYRRDIRKAEIRGIIKGLERVKWNMELT